MTSNFTEVEFATKEGHIAATVIYPNGTKNCQQLPFVDDDGDNMLISEIKRMLLSKNHLNEFNPEHYDLVLVKDEDKLVTQDSTRITHYFNQLTIDRYKITFERRN